MSGFRVDLPTKAGHDGKQVIDDFSARAMGAHLQIESGVHVHCDSLDVLAALFAQQFEEWPDRFATVAFADPQHAHTLSIHDHRRVAVPLVQGEFIHHQPTHTLRIESTVPGLQTPMVDAFDGVPVQARELSNVGDRQDLHQRFDPGSQSVRDAPPSVEPVQAFGHTCPTLITVEPANGYIQPDASIKPISIAHQTSPALVEQDTVTAAATTSGAV